MDYNYHAHTYRCHHASGTEVEYIERAIAGGIRRMGFSEHIPHRFPDGYQSGYRMFVEDTADYFATLRSLREQYADKIDLKIGFEMEYYPKYFSEMLKNAVDCGAEYLILGQHFLYNEHPDGAYSGTPTNGVRELREYVDCVVAGIESGVFSYVAHPDVVRCSCDDATYRAEMRRICDASLEHGIPLEINFLGIREGRNYPEDRFWAIAGEVGCPVTFGFDAHASAHAYDDASLPKAQTLVEKYKLNYVGEPTLIPIQPK